MYHFEGYFLGKDRLRLYWQGWQPDCPIKCIIWFVHGLADHSGRYDVISNKLENKGYAVYGFDRRGCGKSEGPRGHASSYETLIDDLRLFQGELEKMHPDIPIILLGNSLGGQLALAYSMNYPQSIHACIALAPWLSLPFKLPWWLENTAAMLNMVTSSMTFDNRLNYEDLSRDRDFIESFKNDPLIHRKISIGLYLQCAKAAQRLLKNPQVLQTPTLLIHGTGDKITSHLGSRQFAEAAPPEFMSYVEIPEGRHVLLQDDCKAEVWLALESWLAKINL